MNYRAIAAPIIVGLWYVVVLKAIAQPFALRPILRRLMTVAGSALLVLAAWEVLYWGLKLLVTLLGGQRGPSYLRQLSSYLPLPIPGAAAIWAAPPSTSDPTYFLNTFALLEGIPWILMLALGLIVILGKFRSSVPHVLVAIALIVGIGLWQFYPLKVPRLLSLVLPFMALVIGIGLSAIIDLMRSWFPALRGSFGYAVLAGCGLALLSPSLKSSLAATQVFTELPSAVRFVMEQQPRLIFASDRAFVQYLVGPEVAVRDTAELASRSRGELGLTLDMPSIYAIANREIVTDRAQRRVPANELVGDDFLLLQSWRDARAEAPLYYLEASNVWRSTYAETMALREGLLSQSAAMVAVYRIS